MGSTQEVTFQGAEGAPVQGRLFAPPRSDEPRPAIVLIHEVFGLDVHACEVAARFAAEGFHVLVPDLYSREGVPGPESTTAEPAPIWDIDSIRSAARGLPDRRALADIDAAAAHLAGLDDVDAERIAAIGFCMGGTLAFLAGCTSLRFAGVVDFYGRVFYPELSAAKPTQPLELALNLDRPLLAFFGGRDEGIPLEDVERMRVTLSSAAKSFDIVVYDEAQHGFFNDLRPNFDAAAARDAWARTLRFLRADL